MPKQPDNKNQSTRHHNRRSPEPGQNHALTLNGRIMVLLLVIGFIAVGCGVLIYKLYTLQIRDAEQYRVQAAEQQLSDTQIPATRGSIYSANGKLLAKSSVVWNIIANPSKCNQDYVAEASQKISELLNGSVSAEKIQEQLSKTNSQYRNPLLTMPTPNALPTARRRGIRMPSTKRCFPCTRNPPPRGNTLTECTFPRSWAFVMTAATACTAWKNRMMRN